MEIYDYNNLVRNVHYHRKWQIIQELPELLQVEGRYDELLCAAMEQLILYEHSSPPVPLLGMPLSGRTSLPPLPALAISARTAAPHVPVLTLRPG